MINWREAPFVRIAFPFVSGILVAIYWNGLSPTAVMILLLLTATGMSVFALTPTTYPRRWMFGIPVPIFFALLGAYLTHQHAELNWKDHFQNTLQPNSEIFLSAVVTENSEKKNNFRLVLSTTNAGAQIDSMHPCSGNLLVYLKKDSTSPTAHPPSYGDIVLLKAKLHLVTPPKNPYSFDYSRYLHFQNIHFQTFITNEDIRTIGANGGNTLVNWSQRCRDTLVQQLKKYIPTGNEYAVGADLVLGYKEAVSDEVQNAYIQTGAMHILAVSGVHIGLIYIAILQLFKFFPSGAPWSKTTQAVVVLVAVWGFTLITGCGGSILRASAMFSFIIIGKSLRRRTNIYNTLAASAFALFLWNPFTIMDIGFQLSYLAVASIVYFHPKIYKLLAFKNRIANWAWETTALGVAAQIGATPISLYYFHQFPTYFWLSGLLAIPISEIALYAGIALFLCQWIPYFDTLIAKTFHASLWLMNQSIFFVQKLPYPTITGIWINPIETILIYIAIFGIVLAALTRKLNRLYITAIASLFLTTSYAYTSYTRTEKKQIIVYNIYKNTLIDCFIQKKCYSLQDTSLEVNKIKFAAANYRYYMGTTHLQPIEFHNNYESDTLSFNTQILSFMGKNIALLDNLPTNPLTLNIDFAILFKNPSFSINELHQLAHFKEIIFDASNSLKRVKKWKEECKSLNIPYYDITEKGAWIKDL